MGASIASGSGVDSVTNAETTHPRRPLTEALLRVLPEPGPDGRRTKGELVARTLLEMALAGDVRAARLIAPALRRGRRGGR